MESSTNPVSNVPSSPAGVQGRVSWRRYLATSDDLTARFVRGLYHRARSFTLPAPRLIVKPALWCFVILRSAYYFVKRVFICEPLFKAYCASYGKNLRTGTFIPWVQGKGDIICGDDVELDGKVGFTFAARYCDRPTLIIGDRTGIAHECSITVAKKITIGSDCMIAAGVSMADSNGHATDATARLTREPPPPEEVREVVIGDRVWIGRHCMIFPGVRIGEGSIISAGSVVHRHVPPYAVVAGNPAKVMFRLKKPEKASE